MNFPRHPRTELHRKPVLPAQLQSRLTRWSWHSRRKMCGRVKLFGLIPKLPNEFNVQESCKHGASCFNLASLLCHQACSKYMTRLILSLSLSPSWVFAMFCQGAPLGPILRYGFPWAPSQNKRFNGHSLRDIKRGATTSLGAFFDVWLPLVALWCGASAKK